MVMMTQEEFMDIRQIRAEGMTYAEIADATGYHRTTISEWIRSGGPPASRAAVPDRLVITEAWQVRVAKLLRAQPSLLSTSVHDVMAAEGFDGSYPTVARAVRQVRGPRFVAAKAASVPIETAPAAEAQFDFADLCEEAKGWGWSVPLFCFGMILSCHAGASGRDGRSPLTPRGRPGTTTCGTPTTTPKRSASP